MQRGLILACASTLALIVAAPAMAAPAPAYNWTGFYVGANVGYGGDQFKYPFGATLTDTNANMTSLRGSATQTSSGFVGGAEVGYVRQLSSGWLLGAEADIDGSGIKGDTNLSIAGSGLAGSVDLKSTINYLGTARVRVGYPLFDGRFAPYVTGGVAYGGVTSRASLALTGLGGASVSQTSTQVGWTAGAGADYQLTDRLSFRTEYLYVDLGRDTLLNHTYSLGGDTLAATLQRQTTAHLVRFGVTYRFGG